MEGSNPGKVVQKRPCLRYACFGVVACLRRSVARCPRSHMVPTCLLVVAHFSARPCLFGGISPGLEPAYPIVLPRNCDTLACLLCCLLLVACAGALVGCWRCRTLRYKRRKIPRSEMGLVRRAQSRWKDRQLFSRAFLFRCGIPGLVGSDPGKVVQKRPFSPRGRLPLAPGPRLHHRLPRFGPPVPYN